MSLEEKLSEFEKEREKPSFWRGFLKSIMSPVGMGVSAHIAAMYAGFSKLETVVSALGVWASTRIIKDQPPGFKLSSYENLVSIGGAFLFTEYLSMNIENKFVMFPIFYTSVLSAFTFGKRIRRYAMKSAVSRAIVKYTPLVSNGIGALCFINKTIECLEQNKGINYSVVEGVHSALTYTLMSYVGLSMLSALLDRGTFSHIYCSFQYLANYYLGDKTNVKNILAKQYENATDPQLKLSVAKRRVFEAIKEQKADNAFLIMRDAMRYTENSIQPWMRDLTGFSRISYNVTSVILAALAHLPTNKVHNGIFELFLATTSALDKNYDVALKILYKCEKSNPQHRGAISLLSSMVHEHMNSAKTTAAYSYTATLVAMQDKLLSKAGKSIHAKVIDPKEHPFLANNFVFYFGKSDDLVRQEDVRQRKHAVCDKNSSVPALFCAPRELLDRAFSAYKYAQGIHLSESTNVCNFHLVAREMGRFHKLLRAEGKPRAYNSVIAERVASLPVVPLLSDSLSVLWKYIGSDFCFDNDLHGKQVIINNDSAIFIDNKPRQPNHRVIDLAKFLAHTNLFSQKFDDQNKLLDTYARGSSVRPDFLSVQCAFPIVAFNSLYWHQQGTEPGFCLNYLVNAQQALSFIRKHYSVEYERDAESFQNIENAITVAQKQVLSESQAPRASVV